MIRDLGVLALACLGVPEPRVLDSMSGSGVRTLRYIAEGGASFVQANDLMQGEHPLQANLAEVVEDGRAAVSHCDALDLYLRSRLDGVRFDLVDADAFGTGQPHLSDGWFAVSTGGLLYLCATDSLTTAGANPHKCLSGYAATAQYFPACNEQGLRLVIGAAWREAAARNLHAAPVFAYFHRPSSSFRVMMRLVRAKRPPAAAFDSLGYAARCPSCGELWTVAVDALGDAAAHRRCSCASGGGGAAPRLSGPMWVGPMHDRESVAAMAAEARARGAAWADAAALLDRMEEEAVAEEGGAFLFYHLGEVERAVAAARLRQPPLATLVALLRAAGHTASQTHMERKALKTSASLEEVVRVVAAASESTT